ncbi:MAG: pyruvate ferredoxin oxidoreductase subunit gamma /delta [Promethearchaeota archaeon CR_4]|nr:MAG: pyruvate ferredoxin oxidoreductase subunit gamma /delta [Candidatus Lokiarchaeota archaeon CR_4]
MALAEDEVIQVRIHARGGQGGVTAGQLLVQAWDGPAKCFPKFGAERQGSPTEAFAQMSKDKDLIRTNAQVYTPRYVLVLDDTLLFDVCVTSGLSAGGWVILNTTKSFDEIKKVIGRSDLNYAKVDATGIALEILGRPITNTAILGAFIKVSGILSLAAIERAIKQQFRGALVESNINVVKAVFDKVEIAKCDIAYNYQKAQGEKLKWSHIEPNYPGADDIALAGVWYVPGGSAKVQTGTWGVYKIKFLKENCINCQACYFSCPDMCIKREKDDKGIWHIVGSDHIHCKGCRICAEVCPGKKGNKARVAVMGVPTEEVTTV